MELGRKSCQGVGVVFVLLLVISEISSFPFYNPDDYSEQVAGIREVLDEIDRQGGLTAAIVPRAYHPPNHRMMRKSQRSNSLRLRFGKRSAEYPKDDADWLENTQTQQLHQRK